MTQPAAPKPDKAGPEKTPKSEMPPEPQNGSDSGEGNTGDGPANIYDSTAITVLRGGWPGASGATFSAPTNSTNACSSGHGIAAVLIAQQ